MGITKSGAVLLAALTTVGVQAKESLTWMSVDLPPATIYDGALAGSGFAEQQLRILFAALPDYDHQIVRGTIARAWHELETRDGLCINWVSRESGMHWSAAFSKHPVPNPGYRLVVKSSRLTEVLPYGTTGEVDLDLLGRNEALTGGYMDARNYLAAINGFIKSEDRGARLEKAMNTGQMVEQLRAGRVDFIFATPVEVAFYKESLHLKEEFVSVRVKGSPAYNDGYIACSSGPAGKAALARIDSYLERPEGWAAYVAPLQRWLDPTDFAIARGGKSR